MGILLVTELECQKSKENEHGLGKWVKFEDKQCHMEMMLVDEG